MDIRTFCCIAITEAKIKAAEQGKQWRLDDIQHSYPFTWQVFKSVHAESEFKIRPVIDEEEKKRTFFLMYDNAIRLLYTGGQYNPNQSADPVIITNILSQSGLNKGQYLDGRAFAQLFSDYDTIERIVKINTPQEQEKIARARKLIRRAAMMAEMGTELDTDEKAKLKKIKAERELELLFKSPQEKMQKIIEKATEIFGKDRAERVVANLSERIHESPELKQSFSNTVDSRDFIAALVLNNIAESIGQNTNKDLPYPKLANIEFHTPAPNKVIKLSFD